MDIPNAKIVLLIILAIAIFLLVISLLLQRKKRVLSRRTPYIDALYALIEGRKQRALNLLKFAVKSGEDDIDAYLQLGHLLREIDKPGKALQIHRNLTVRKDLTPVEEKNIILAIAEDLELMGKIDKAIKELEAINKKYRDSNIYRTLHRLYHKAGYYNQAYSYLKDLSKLDEDLKDTNLAGYLAAVSEVLIEENRIDQAEVFLKKAIKIDNENIPATYIAANLAMEEGNTKNSIKEWTKLLKLDMGNFNWILPKLEKCLYDYGKFDELETILEDMLDEYPGNSSVINALASYYEKKGELEKARDRLEEEGIKVDGEIYNRLKLALLYIKLGEYQHAKEMIEGIERNFFGDAIFRCVKCEKELYYPGVYCNSCYSFGTYVKDNEVSSS